MTLFKKLEELIGLGWKISFSSFAFQFQISISKELINGESINRESSMPLSDHFYESRIVQCIDYMVNEITKEIYPSNNS